MITLDEAKKEVGKGWWGILERAYAVLPEESEVLQVKEKWGGLRIYIAGATVPWYDCMHQLEEVSLETCEMCGAPGKQVGRSWIKTLCPKCEVDWNNGKKTWE